MIESKDVNDLLDAIAKVLIRCFGFGIAILCLWFLIIVVASDFVYRFHSTWFDISKQQFDAIHYTGMAITKTIVVVFFLLPYISIRMVLARN